MPPPTSLFGHDRLQCSTRQRGGQSRWFDFRDWLPWAAAEWQSSEYRGSPYHPTHLIEMSSAAVVLSIYGREQPVLLNNCTCTAFILSYRTSAFMPVVQLPRVCPSLRVTSTGHSRPCNSISARLTSQLAASLLPYCSAASQEALSNTYTKPTR